MKKISLLAVACLACISGPTFGAIVYSGSQNVTVALDGAGSPPPAIVDFSIAGSPSQWDDFSVGLVYDGPSGEGSMMTIPHTDLVIGGTLGIGMGMGMGTGAWRGVLEAFAMAPMGGMVVSGWALNLAAGDPIGPGPWYSDVEMLLSQGLDGDTQFGRFDGSGGYIGLAMSGPAPGDIYYGWLHMSGMSNIGFPNQIVTFDGWAYDDVVGRTILAGDTGAAGIVPVPSALVLGGIGVGLLARRRRR